MKVTTRLQRRARNIYDVLRQVDEIEDADGDEDIWVPEEPCSPLTQQSPSPAVPQQPTQKARTPIVNESIITMLPPSRHIFRGWQHQTFPIHNDVGLEVARTIVLKIATAINQPTPAIPTTKDMRSTNYGEIIRYMRSTKEDVDPPCNDVSMTSSLNWGV
jgi:hypothetical protein